jgi:hypothetical protein
VGERHGAGAGVGPDSVSACCRGNQKRTGEYELYEFKCGRRSSVAFKCSGYVVHALPAWHLHAHAHAHAHAHLHLGDPDVPCGGSAGRQPCTCYRVCIQCVFCSICSLALGVRLCTAL